MADESLSILSMVLSGVLISLVSSLKRMNITMLFIVPCWAMAVIGVAVSTKASNNSIRFIVRLVLASSIIKTKKRAICYIELEKYFNRQKEKRGNVLNVTLYPVLFSLWETLCYGRGTRPLKPMKAMARMPAVTSAMGTPFMPLGVPVRSICSRRPAKITSAMAKPTAIEAE